MSIEETTITGTVYRASNVREKVTYGALEMSNGRKVDVVAFPNTQPAACKTIAAWNVGDVVTITGIEKETEKTKYAMQFFPSGSPSEGKTVANSVDVIDLLDMHMAFSRPDLFGHPQYSERLPKYSSLYPSLFEAKTV